MVGITSYQTPINTIPYTTITHFESQEGNLHDKSKQDENEIHKIIFLDREGAKAEKRLKVVTGVLDHHA
jgi:hypothetical protein